MVTLHLISLAFFQSTAKENKCAHGTTPVSVLCGKPLRKQNLHSVVAILDPLDKTWIEGLHRLGERSNLLKGLSVLWQMGR